MDLYIQIFIMLTLTFYVLGSIFYFTGLITKKTTVLKGATLLTIFGSLFNLLILICRTLIVGRLPIVSGYEFILCFAFLTSLLYLAYEWKSKSKGAGGIVIGISALLTLFVVTTSLNQLSNVSELMPALKSMWLTSHVVTAALAYAFFALAAGLAAIQIWNSKKGSSIDMGTITMVVAAGFIMMSITIVIGAIWAEQAWGSYWSWDPKEVWALITWIIYAIYLHLYRKKLWHGKKACWMVIIGFLVVLFTFFGVNYLLSGLHSYAAVSDYFKSSWNLFI